MQLVSISGSGSDSSPRESPERLGGAATTGVGAESHAVVMQGAPPPPMFVNPTAGRMVRIRPPGGLDSSQPTLLRINVSIFIFKEKNNVKNIKAPQNCCFCGQ